MGKPRDSCKALRITGRATLNFASLYQPFTTTEDDERSVFQLNDMAEVQVGDPGCCFLLQICSTSRIHAESNEGERKAGTETWS